MLGLLRAIRGGEEGPIARRLRTLDPTWHLKVVPLVSTVRILAVTFVSGLAPQGCALGINVMDLVQKLICDLT